ncbi:ParB/RepB/Spo0J family partition protein [Catenovulum sp. 2E275]|uniref:ParB/RepB/Spo0J family partition protein n=1 Tax=Catenovulum sp. 2E275 TaxID=2980497 RepID=UPI0021D0E86A|nr:ParB/RepB/Spo0J family partition protein [Catenovulum sp. 2E275]MCU4674170.1 ParB/RepB/Spo0J family partition protein [Catenovulum sp. 2E275]
MIKKRNAAMANLMKEDLNMLSGLGNKSKSSAVDLEMDTFDPTEILPKKANIAPVNQPAKKVMADVGSFYMLPSGKRTKCKLILIDEPASQTQVWHGNPRFNEDPPVEDIIESIESNGTNAEPVKVKLNHSGIYEVITGSRRRKATIAAKKPLTALLLEEISDDDAKMLAVIENEGRLDPNPFTIAASYLALLAGDNPVFDSVTTLAKRLGKSRTWASQVLSINDLPEIIETSLSENEKYKLSIRRVVELATLWRRIIKENLTAKAESELTKLAKIDLKNSAECFKNLLEVKNKPKSFSVKTEKDISDKASLIKTPDGFAIMIKVNSDNESDLLSSLNETIEKLS